MKVILVFVTSVDGKITQWGNPVVRSWSSKEDQHYFSGLMKSSLLIVMGSSTYKVEPVIPSIDRLVVVMTGNPEKYRNKEIPGQVEFSDKTPAALTKFLENRGYQEMLMVGGPHVATSFLRKNLVNEIWLTVEPRIFGSGGSFVTDEMLDVHLELLSTETINRSGTLINKYLVVR